ncbi:MAG TPA: ATP-binding protein, partial [Chloroflexota bacterium]|nr:ATP-binding protein [Chloroflexota bacterium]
MIPMQFNAVAWDDIEALVTVGRPEDRALEYKQELPGNSDDDKKEFLADLSALANTAGGDLIYGIEEQRDAQGKPTGIPTSIHGITVANMDSEIRRLENLLRDSVEPRMLGIRMKPLQAQDG